MSETSAHTKKVDIALCSSCMVKHVPSVTLDTAGPARFDQFVSEVRTQLEGQRPDILWAIKTQSCFRFCPENKITLSVSQKTTMSGQASVDSIVKEILTHPMVKKIG